MVYRFLKTLKTHEIEASAEGHRLPHYSSTAAISLFMRHPDKLEETEREHLAAFLRASPSLETTYQLVQDFLVMMRKLGGERLDAWLLQVHESQLPELESFAHGVERGKSAVQAGLTLAMNNGQAYDVWQSRFSPPASTGSAPHLKTTTYLRQEAYRAASQNRANCRSFLV
jgi:transposase